MVLPFLRSLVKNLKDKYFIYMIILAIIFNAVLPISEYLLWHGAHTLNSDFIISWLLTSTVLYPCVGYYLENRLDLSKVKKYIPYMWIINIVTIFISCFMTYYKAKITGICDEGNSQAFHSSFVLINVITLFITAKWMFDRDVSVSLAKTLTSVGGATFGIYLLHIIARDLLYKLEILDFLKDTLHINDMISILILCLLVFIIGYLITLLLKLIPGIRKFI